jgi:hypothetical protein
VFIGLANLALTTLLLYASYRFYLANPTIASIATSEDSSSNRNNTLHLLIPATRQDKHLCKTLLTAAVLGYPSPVILGWGSKKKYAEWLIDDGTHLAKISQTLQYLENLSPDHDNDLVLMVDGYDIWFQFGPQVLIERYHHINANANALLRKRLGQAYEVATKQSVVFGAGKRCAPNALSSIGCYPVPDSPVPMDTYGHNTDTNIGWNNNNIASLRQRYLNSGYAIGPVYQMRDIFRRAQEMAELHKDHPIYLGSDQAHFVNMFGMQEYVREMLRVRYLSYGFVNRLSHLFSSPKPATSYQQGAFIDNILDPSFTHEKFSPEPGKQYDFGIGLDYFSDLGHQTMNSDIGHDSQWLTYANATSASLQEQVLRSGHRAPEDCPLQYMPSQLPSDIARSRPPLPASNSRTYSWTDVSLYTHLCLGTLPVMIHQNGEKSDRDNKWPRLWVNTHSRELWDIARSQTLNHSDSEGLPWAKGGRAGDSWIYKGSQEGEWLKWESICQL